MPFLFEQKREREGNHQDLKLLAFQSTLPSVIGRWGFLLKENHMDFTEAYPKYENLKKTADPKALARTNSPFSRRGRCYQEAIDDLEN